jgi:hypothetical protein
MHSPMSEALIEAKPEPTHHRDRASRRTEAESFRTAMQSALLEFEPDQRTVDLLGQEHHHGTWIGPRLLDIANRIRNQGGSEDDYRRWVMSSYLWRDYTSSTSDSAAAQRRTLASSWDKSETSLPFDLADALPALYDRIASALWVGRSGSRNREVALAFVRFCWEHNCFTRTISSYELSKRTAGLSPATVGRALLDLINLGLLFKIERTDRRASKRSTCRYQVNLRWTDPKSVLKPPKGNHVTEARNTCKYSLPHLRDNAGQDDLWSSRGLGLTAGRVYVVLADEPATVREISKRAGVSDGQARRAVAKLADHCLAGTIPGRPARYFKVETPLYAIADMLGCAGYVDHVIDQTEARQQANRIGYPSAYSRRSTTA